MVDRLQFWRFLHTQPSVWAPLSVLLLAALSFEPTTAWAQDAADPPVKKVAGGAAKGEDGEKKELPEPEVLDLDTKDGLQLKATYYPGNDDKKTVPIVIIHDFEGNRNEYHPLALTLQAEGHAVIVPDLRGHGESTTFKSDPGVDKVREIKAKSMKRNDFDTILGTYGDLQAIRRFLLNKNNEGELNINRLCVVGVGMGATLGLNWTAADWAYPPLAGKKQGQDVHALVVVSPVWSFKGMLIAEALKQASIQREVALLIAVGSTPKAKKDADRIFKSLEKFRPEPPADQVQAKKTLFLREVDAALEGAKLLNEKNSKLDKTLITFIKWRLVDQDFPWSER